MAEAQISTRELPDNELEERLVRAVRARGGKVTEADIVVESGVPPHQVGPGLRAMLAQYRSHISVTDDGDLLYEFERSLARRDAVPWAGVKAVGRALWRGFRAVYKVAIAVVLVGYVVVFVALLVAALLARSGSNSSDSEGRSSSGDGGFGFGGFDSFLFWGFGWGQPSRRQRALFSRTRRPSVPFYKKVFQFVFGPEKPRNDDLADERGLLAWIRTQGGVISPTELAARTGWSLNAAEQESTKLLARYGGDVEVTEDGRMLYTFSDIVKTAQPRREADAAEAGRAFLAAWEPREPLTGNSAAANVGIGLMNAFVLISATVILPGFVVQRLGIDLTQTAVWSWLVGIPAVYATLFFGVPLVRQVLAVAPENRRRALRNLRRAILREAFAGRSPEPAAIAATVPPGLPAAGSTPSAVEDSIKRIGFEFDAAVEPDESGRIVWRWDRIAGERAAAEARRQGEKTRLVEVGAKALAFTSR